MTNERTTIVLATGNRGKLAELQQLVGSEFDVRSATELGVIMPEETGGTFAENALLKAVSAWEQTGLISVADDSGLEVDALDGEPGVYSARYAGEGATDEANNRKLLAAVEHVEADQRTARFRSCIALVLENGDQATFDGAVEGRIGTEPRGSGGFGYDPLFVFEDGRTMAELPPEEKNALSHRGVAMRKAIPALLAHLKSKGGTR